MNRFLSSIFLCLAITVFAEAQAKRTPKTPIKPREIGSTAVVMDETLSVLRLKPSLYAEPIQRMRRGRVVKILGVSDADGVKFYRVSAPPSAAGWVQADSVFGKFREGEDARLAMLVRSMSGFDQIEAAVEFFKLYPTSQFRPALLLLVGDLIEEAASKLSRDANSRLDRREMAATAAPMHSYYLNYVGLDRYRKLGIRFNFNPSTRHFHHNGASWLELTQKYANTPESAEAHKRLDSLRAKLSKGSASP